jgi:hypothetical protein
VQALAGGPLVGKLRSGAVFVVDAAGAGFGERVQDRVQLGAEGCGEAAFEVPHAVAALFEFDGAALLLVLVVYGFGAVSLDIVGIEAGAGELCMARSTMATLSGVTAPTRCSAASRGSCGSSCSPSMEVRGPTAAAARTRPAASPWERCSTRIRNWGDGGGAVFPGQVAGCRGGDQAVIN